MSHVDRTDRALKIAIRLFVIPGFLAATYLSYAKVFDKAIACASGGCEVIEASNWSELAGIPVTIIGMVTYIVIFGSTFVKNENAKLIAAFAAVCGAVFSIWLQYQALFVMKHFCPYCFTSAVCMQFLAALTITRVVRLPTPGSYVDLGSDAEAKPVT